MIKRADLDTYEQMIYDRTLDEARGMMPEQRMARLVLEQDLAKRLRGRGFRFQAQVRAQAVKDAMKERDETHA